MEKLEIIELLDNVLERQQHCHIVACANELKYFREQSFQSIAALELIKENINNIDPALPSDVVSILKQIRNMYCNAFKGSIGKKLSDDADKLLKQYLGNQVS